jgi:hypothetical protein
MDGTNRSRHDVGMSRKSRRKQKQGPTLPPAGRTLQLTPDTHAKIVQGARNGVPITFLGPLVGLSTSCVMKWLTAGKRATSGPHFALFHAVKTAQAEYVQSCIGEIRTAAPKTWQAAAWLLERMHRDEFGGDKLELNQLKKELRELRALVVQVPNVAGEEAAPPSLPTAAASPSAADHTPALPPA